MAIRSNLLMVLVAWTACSAGAQSADPPGDNSPVFELERHAGAASVLEHDLLALLEVTLDEQRFDLYWTYNALIGAWVQVDRLQTLLESDSPMSASNEEALSAAIREQAQFALWEIGETDRQLADQSSRLERADLRHINGAVRALLAQVHATIGRYWLAVMPPST